MTPPESPASLLERAATRLEELANDKHIAKSPWKADGSVVWAADDYLVLGGAPWDNDREPDPDADWIAIMSPAVAQPLANILRGVAFTLKCHPEYADTERNYLDLARSILGESP